MVMMGIGRPIWPKKVQLYSPFVCMNWTFSNDSIYFSCLIPSFEVLLVSWFVVLNVIFIYDFWTFFIVPGHSEFLS